jgi:hypothetical protein
MTARLLGSSWRVLCRRRMTAIQRAAGWNRRIADVADRDRGRLNWADTDPTIVAYGTPAIDVLRT